jgi:hypothetical protein
MQYCYYILGHDATGVQRSISAFLQAKIVEMGKRLAEKQDKEKKDGGGDSTTDGEFMCTGQDIMPHSPLSSALRRRRGTHYHILLKVICGHSLSATRG